MLRLVLGAIALMLSTSWSLSQTDSHRGQITISGAWTRATVSAMTVGGGYMKITNRGSAPDRLVSLTTPVAERVEVHRTTIVDGMARMRQLTEGLLVPAGQSVELAPGGLHLMLVRLKQPLQGGQSVPLTLIFERAGTVTTTMAVMPMGAMTPTK